MSGRNLSLAATLLVSVLLASSRAFLAPVFSAGNRNIVLCSGPSFGLSDTSDDRLQTIQLALDRVRSLEVDSLLAKYTPRRNVTTVGVSTIDGAGSGMFATANIKAGTLLFFYPVHALGVDFGDDGSMSVASHTDDQQFFDTLEETGKSNYLQYLVGLRALTQVGEPDFESSSLFIDVNPERTIGDEWSSHYINDGATVLENSEKGMLDYYRKSRERKNCVHIPFGPSPIVASVTTRKVRKGEELFTSYGCSYWLEAMLAEEEECADVTEEVTSAVKQTASDLFDAMMQARSVYSTQEDELEEVFSKLLL